MGYNDVFMTMSNSPAKRAREQYEEIIDIYFENSPTFYDDIGMEVANGTLIFEPINARVNRQIDYKVGNKSSDDFRKIIFDTIDFKPTVGMRFSFENNIWIAYSTNNVKATASSAYIRRCNNTINIQDRYGNIHNEPCAIEDNLLNRNVTEDDYMTVIKGSRTVYAQYNQWTRNFDIGDRFVFGRQGYKMTNFAEIQRNETFDDNTVRMFVAYIDIDLNNAYDKYYDENGNYLGVADYKEFNFDISVPENLYGFIGDTGTIENKIFLNGESFENNLVFESDEPDVLTIDNETGVWSMEDEGDATIKVYMVEKPEVYSEIVVKVENVSVQNYTNVLEPRVDSIPLQQVKSFSIYEALNGIKNNTTFTITCDKVKSDYYELNIIDGNNFNIKNLRESRDVLLEVTCENNRDNSTELMILELGGIF